MSDDLWTLVRYLHLLAVAGWVGGMVALGLVTGRAARSAEGVGAARRVVRSTWRRFNRIAASAIVVLVATGLALARHRGIGPGDLVDGDYGRRLLAKAGLLVAMAGVLLVHPRWRGRARMAGDAVLLLAGLAAVWLGVSLVP